MATNYRYPLGTPSTGGVDRLLIDQQQRIRRQSSPKEPPENFPADPWIVPAKLWTQAQTTEIQNLANAEAIRADAEDLRVNFTVEGMRERLLSSGYNPRPPMPPEMKEELEVRQHVGNTIARIQQEYPGVAAPVEWDDGTQAIFDYFNGKEPRTRDGSLRDRTMNRGTVQRHTNDILSGVGNVLSKAFGGRDFVGELVAWTTAFADNPTLNPEELSRDKEVWRREYDKMYEELPRPAQIFIDEVNPGNFGLVLASGGLSAVLRASGSPIAKATASVIEPIAGGTFKSVPLELAAATAARVGYEQTDGAPMPIRLAVGAAAAMIAAHPNAIVSPTGKAVRNAWRGLTEAPNLSGVAPNPQGTTLNGVIGPIPPRRTPVRAGTGVLVPDVIDLEVPQPLRSYKSPVNYGAPELTETALDRAADFQMQVGVANGFASGQPVPPNAAHALARAQDALEFSGNNRFINAINRATDDKIIRQSYWAEQAASSEYAARIYPSRVKFLDWMERTFGSTRNLPDSMEYVGPRERSLWGDGVLSGTKVAAEEFPTHRTIVDALVNPQYYTWGDIDRNEVKRWMQWFQQRNLRANEALRGYGGEIGDFRSPQWGEIGEFFFPTINRASQRASIADPDAVARGISGRLREREFTDLFERLRTPLEMQGGVFEPELDFANAFTSLDNAKALGAGRNTFRLGIGGSLTPRAGWIEVPALSNDLRKVYLPEEQAKTVARYFDQGDSVQLFNYLNILKNTALNADASPLTIQGSLAWFASPYDTSAQILGAARRGETFRAFTPTYLAEQIASDPQGWANFSFWMGMSPNAGTPAEFRTGLLEAIPGIGSKIGQWNDNVMSVLMQWMKREFDDQASMLVKEGFSQDQAFAAAADVVRMVVPMSDSRKLGLTASSNIIQRGLVTSVSFIRQPIQFMDDAFTGYLKLGLKVPDEVLGAIRQSGRRLEDVITERQALQSTLDQSLSRLDEIDMTLRGMVGSADEATRSSLRAERNVIANSIKALQPDIDSLLEEESLLRLTGRTFSPGTREAWATLTPRERAAAQTFAKMAGGITGLTTVTAMLTAEERGLTPEEAVQRALPGGPDFWKVFLGGEFSVSVGGPLRTLTQAVAPGENGIPFENIGRWTGSKLTPPLRAMFDLVRNEDYYGQEIRSGNFAQQVLQSIAYAAMQVAPISVTTPIELSGQGYSRGEVAAQVSGQFLGQNILPPSHYERLERVRRQSARDLIANPSSWEAAGMTQEQMNAARSTRNLTELREAIGTRAANHLVEFGNPEADEAIAAYVEELRRRADGGDRDAEALLVSWETQRRLEAEASLAVDANGVLDKALYRSQRGEVIAQMVGQNAAFRDVFEAFGTSDNEIDRLSSEWYALFDRATVRTEVDGETVEAGVDFELFNQLEEQFLGALGPEKAALVEANVAVAPRGANPAEEELRQVRRDLEANGFWNIEDQVWSQARKVATTTIVGFMENGALGDRISSDVAKTLTASLLTAQTYGDFRTKVKEVLTQQFADAGIKPETAVQIAKQRLGSLPDIRAIDNAISEAKVAWAMEHQELAESAIQWGYLSASEANVVASQLDALMEQQAAQEPETGGQQPSFSPDFSPANPPSPDAFKPAFGVNPKRSSSSELARMARDFTENGLSYTQLAEKYGLSSRGAAEQRLRRHFGESPAAVRERLRETAP